MTRTVQSFAVTGILVASLTVTAFGAMSVQRSGASPGAADAAVALARLDDVEPALAQLLEAARRYAAGGGPASRQALDGALARFAEARARVERVPAGALRREDGQLFEALRALVPRIHLLALEIAAIGDPQASRAAADKSAPLERLAQKTRVALAQLSESGQIRAEAGREKVLAPLASAPAVPEGVAVLLLTVACAVSVGFFSSWRHSHPVRRALARESRRWRCLQ